MAPSQLGAFLKSSPELAFPDLQWHVQPLSLDKFGDEKLHSFPGMTAGEILILPFITNFFAISNIMDAPSSFATRQYNRSRLQPSANLSRQHHFERRVKGCEG